MSGVDRIVYSDSVHPCRARDIQGQRKSDYRAVTLIEASL